MLKPSLFYRFFTSFQLGVFELIHVDLGFIIPMQCFSTTSWAKLHSRAEWRSWKSFKSKTTSRDSEDWQASKTIAACSTMSWDNHIREDEPKLSFSNDMFVEMGFVQSRPFLELKLRVLRPGPCSVGISKNPHCCEYQNNLFEEWSQRRQSWKVDLLILSLCNWLSSAHAAPLGCSSPSEIDAKRRAKDGLPGHVHRANLNWLLAYCLNW